MTGAPVIALIAALDVNGVIGKDNALPWHIPEDLKYFRRMTMGKPVVMGRKCYESLGRPLAGRLNIVMTRRPETLNVPEGVRTAASLEDALREAARTGVDEIMILGGAQVYAEALPVARRLYLTRIGHAYGGDTLFPAFDEKAWTVVSEDRREGDPPLTFQVLERTASP